MALLGVSEFIACSFVFGRAFRTERLLTGTLLVLNVSFSSLGPTNSNLAGFSSMALERRR